MNQLWLHLDVPPADLTEWKQVVSRIATRSKTCTIALVGKYVKLHDAYLSVMESLYHAGFENDSQVEIRWVESEDLTDQAACKEAFADVDGIIVPGGFGDRGIEGMIQAAQYARENRVPCFGICLGMQIMVIEFARNVLGYKDANSSEFSAYCTIHYARGASRNMPIADLVKEAEQIAAAGQREIVITGINTGDFGRTTGERFIDLLRALNEVEGIERYRISSIEPNLLTDEIIAFCASSPKFQHHFHIPLQSGSDSVLARMRRRYTTAKFAERIEAVRRLMPDAFIGIDVIVGFPGETEADFRTTYEFLERLAPAYLHIFPFSERSGTPAVDFPDKVQPSVATRRVEELEKLCRRLHGEFCARAEGTTDEVLFESTMRGGMMFGYTGNYRRVKVLYDRSRINTICRVRLGRMDDANDLEGEIVDN